jgi:2-polyprenyl-6-methoxyphenol hydroxylase-like FAD-dependent oxidoreductase
VNPRILIAGAGLAGLTLKHALNQRGIAADLVERSPSPRADGHGLCLPANAVRALHDLGLGPVVEKESAPVRRQEIRDDAGNLLTAADLLDVWNGVGDCLAIRRNALHDILLTAAGRTGVRHGTRLVTVGADGTAVFGDGTTGRYDLIAGADGLDSVVRPATVRPRFLGQVSWRFVARSDAVPPGTWTVRLGSRGRSFQTVPLGDGDVYCVATAGSRAPHAPDGDWRFLFGGFGEVAGELLDAAVDPYFTAHHEVPPAGPAAPHTAPGPAGPHTAPGPAGAHTTPGQVGPHTVLVGDAGHASSPSLAQGAAMAFEDALTLADLLAAGDDLPGALATFRERRAGRLRAVRDRGSRRDRARSLPAPVRVALFRRYGLRLLQSGHAQLLDRP